MLTGVIDDVNHLKLPSDSTMSWFTRSITNTFNLNDNDSPLSPKQGVKEDLSEITKTLTTKIWGVASFLAPSHQSETDAPDTVTGIRRDFAEIGGRFRSGISKLSNNIDVSEITKLASNILQLSPDTEAIGVTDQVLGFVRDVTMHPETWMDFPLLVDQDDDSEEFELSDAQQEHALAVENLVPRLPALRIELCPGYMSEGSFWKIYFVLVHPKLEPHVAELLSTPEIVKARGSLTHELKARSVPSGTQPETVPLEASTLSLTTSGVSVVTETTEKHSVPTEEIQIVDKSVIQEEPSRSITNVVEDKDEDDWLKEDGSENVNISGATTVRVENDEDVSFSDLEDDEDLK